MNIAQAGYHGLPAVTEQMKGPHGIHADETRIRQEKTSARCAEIFGEIIGPARLSVEERIEFKMLAGTARLLCPDRTGTA